MAGKLVEGGLVPFDEFTGDGNHLPSPRYSGGTDNIKVVREGLIAFANINAALAELAPDPPSQVGVFPGVPYLYVTGWTIDPWPETQPDTESAYNAFGVTNYLRAKITVEYGSLQRSDADLIARRRTHSLESISVNAVDARWEDGGLIKIPVDHFKRVGITDHHITVYRASTDKDAAIRANIGCVNSATFEGAAAETLLFTGVDEDFQYGTSGVKSRTRTYHFRERRIVVGSNVYGWNHAFREETGAWERVKYKDGSYMHLLSSAFNTLF